MKRRNITELVIGAPYATGAGFQAFDTLRKSEEFYRGMADQAWLRPAGLFVERALVPNSFAVTVLVVIFQASLAIAIFSRGAAVRPALVAGGVFSTVGALTGGPTIPRPSRHLHRRHLPSRSQPMNQKPGAPITPG